MKVKIFLEAGENREEAEDSEYQKLLEEWDTKLDALPYRRVAGH